MSTIEAGSKVPDNARQLITSSRIFRFPGHVLTPFDLKKQEDSFIKETAKFEEDEPYGFELVVALKRLGFRLNPYIEFLLSEIGLDGYAKRRYGNGVMRASMWLFKYAKKPVDDKARQEVFRNGFARASVEKKIFKDEDLINVSPEDILEAVPDINEVYDQAYLSKLKELPSLLTKSANVLLGQMLIDLFFPVAEETVLSYIDTNNRSGSCSDAESAFRMIANMEGSYFGSLKGIATIYTKYGKPIVLEKQRGFGDPHSGINIEPIVFNGVKLPPGTLIGVQRRPHISKRSTLYEEPRTEIEIKDLEGIEGIDPIRLSAYSLPEGKRADAFKGFSFREQGLNIDDFRKFCEEQMLLSEK